MPTPVTHAVISLAAGGAAFGGRMPLKFWLLAGACAALPDLDVIGLRLGIPYGHLLGHRGLSHSLPFAAVVSVVVMLTCFAEMRRLSGRWWALLAFFFVIAAAHGVLDAMTDGGLGIAFFSPFSNARYFLPWRPLRVSPIGIGRFISPWGLRVIRSELLWLWLPAGGVLAIGALTRQVLRRVRPVGSTEPR